MEILIGVRRWNAGPRCLGEIEQNNCRFIYMYIWPGRIFNAKYAGLHKKKGYIARER